jgi:hypothetical protein
MPTALAHSKCFQHLNREAVARCPSCQRFYCRECVTEHEGRMICRPCLDDLLQDDVKESAGIGRLLITWMLAGIGFITTGAFFYFVGRILLAIPSNFHSGAFFD